MRSELWVQVSGDSRERGLFGLDWVPVPPRFFHVWIPPKDTVPARAAMAAARVPRAKSHRPGGQGMLGAGASQMRGTPTTGEVREDLTEEVTCERGP